MTWFLAVELTVIVIFLIMFLRRPSVIWSIGLLTVTTAVLLDALLDTFDSEALHTELGFFYFVIAGSLFGGAAIWLWGILLPFVDPFRSNPALEQENPLPSDSYQGGEKGEDEDNAVDSQLLYQEIHDRFGREDVLDLMFDLNINENDVMTVDQKMSELISNIMEFARRNGQTSALALAVERILTPPPPDHLPRLEKISTISPPTILRHYLLTYSTLENLQQMAIELGIDWEQLDAGAKKEKVRSFLQVLYRRNRLAELVDLMHERGQDENVKAY